MIHSSFPSFTHRILVFFVLVFTMAGCASKSGTRVSTDSAALQSIKSIQLSVTSAEPFSIRKSDNNTGANVGAAFGLVGVLIGAGIDSARTSSTSSTLEGSVSLHLKEFDGRMAFATKVQNALLQSKRFDRVDQQATGSTSGASDGHFMLNMEDWGLRSCVGGASPDHMQVAVHIDGKLIARTDKRTLWERDELYLDPICRRFEEFRDQTGLLTERLNQSLESLSGVLVNRVLYP